jgi:hypothetical protein
LAALVGLAAALPLAPARAFDPEAYRLALDRALPRPPVVAPSATDGPVLRRPGVVAKRLRHGLGASVAQTMVGDATFGPGPATADLLRDRAPAGQPPHADLQRMMQIATTALQGFADGHADLARRVAALERSARREGDGARAQAIADLARLWALRAHNR